MSHFSLLLITDEKPNDELIAELMAPFDEQTEDPDFRVFKDTTEEFKRNYEGQKIDNETYEQFLERSGEYVNDQGQVGYYHNPQAQWDWYVIGGRFRGGLILKEGAQGLLGEAGVGGNPPQVNGGVDQAQVKDVDFDAMLEHAKQESLRLFAAALADAKASDNWPKDVADDHAFLNEVLANAKKAWPILWAQRNNVPNFWDWINENDTDEKKAITKMAGLNLGGYTSPVTWTSGSLEEIMQGLRPLITYAILKDGEWSDAHETEDFDAIFSNTLAELKPEQYITIIDCHI